VTELFTSLSACSILRRLGLATRVFAGLLSLCCIVGFEATSSANELFSVVIGAPPEPDARLSTLYEDKHGRTVVEYDLGTVTDNQVRFSDGKPLFDLSLLESQRLASTPFLLGRFYKAHGLTPLENVFFNAVTYRGVTLQITTFGARHCSWPFDGVLNIKRGDAPVRKIMFFRRRDEPRQVEYQDWCESGSGTTKLSTRYDSAIPLLVLSGVGRPLIALSQPPIVLTLGGSSVEVGPHVTRDVIAVDAQLVESKFRSAAIGEMSAEAAISTTNAELDLAMAAKSVR
jgi:hypothetical protein